MKENAQVLDFELAADDMAQLDTMTTAQALQDFKVCPVPVPQRRSHEV